MADIDAALAQAKRRADKAESALLAIVYALGPERICRCSVGDPDCGLREEAQHALDVARGHLADTGYGMHRA